jgi:hypothetical protein
MKVASVSIDIDNLPSKEIVIEMALKTELYNSDPEAVKNIEIEIEKSGLWKVKTEEDGGLHTVLAESTKKPKFRK